MAEQPNPGPPLAADQPAGQPGDKARGAPGDGGEDTPALGSGAAAGGDAPGDPHPDAQRGLLRLLLVGAVLIVLGVLGRQLVGDRPLRTASLLDDTSEFSLEEPGAPPDSLFAVPMEPGAAEPYDPFAPFDPEFDPLDPADEPTDAAPDDAGHALDPAQYPDSTRPSFSPMTERPELLNRDEVDAALERGYPRELRGTAVAGTPVVWLFLGEDGRVLRAQLRESSGNARLDSAAVELAPLMRFSPARNGSRAVRAWISVPVEFPTPVARPSAISL